MTHGGYLARFSRTHQFRAFQGAVLAERERFRARAIGAFGESNVTRPALVLGAVV